LPVVAGAWLSWELHGDPDAMRRLTEPFLPEAIEEMTPAIALMTYFDLLMIPIILLAVIHASKFVAGEKSKNTLQLIVTRPIKRWKIIIGKYAAFVFLFIPLMILSVLLMTISIEWIGVGWAEKEVFLGFATITVLYTLVYASIATLFSSLTKKSLSATLASFIFLIIWLTLDFLIMYLPENIAEMLEHVSLSHYANQILGYISDGVGAIFAVGGIPVDPSTQTFIYSSLIVLSLILIPILLAITALGRIELY